jgi:hypothetical protein
MTDDRLARDFSQWLETASLRAIATLCLMLSNELYARGQGGAVHLSCAAKELDAIVRAARVG